MDSVDERHRRIIDVLITLQPGEVTTYGDVADVAGYPNCRASWVASWRRPTSRCRGGGVVNSSGRLVPGNERLQTELLLEEDVIIRDGKVRSAPHGRFSDL